LDQRDSEDDDGDRRGDDSAHPLQLKLLTLELQLALMILRIEPKSLLQQPIVGRPLLRVAEESVGGDNLPESRQSIWVVGVDVGMGRLGGFAERLFEGFIVGIRRNAKQIVERLHRHALEQPSSENSPSNFLNHQLNDFLTVADLEIQMTFLTVF
jgi:hypothetical protein